MQTYLGYYILPQYGATALRYTRQNNGSKSRLTSFEAAVDDSFGLVMIEEDVDWFKDGVDSVTAVVRRGDGFDHLGGDPAFVANAKEKRRRNTRRRHGVEKVLRKYQERLCQGIFESRFIVLSGKEFIG